MDAAPVLTTVRSARETPQRIDGINVLRHELPNVLTIALCATVGGAESWTEVELYGKAKLPWLRSFLHLPSDIPTRAVFEQVFDRVDPVACDALVLPWAQALVRRAAGDLIVAHNTAVRHSPRRAALLSATDEVSIWASEHRLIFGQLAASSSSNEDTAIPALLTLLNIDDSIVAIDARQCQAATARAVYELGEQYVIALPQGASAARTIAEQFVTDAQRRGWHGIPHQHLAAVESSHDTTEKAHYWLTSDPALLAALNHNGAWPALATVCFVERETSDASGSHRHIATYLSSLEGETPGLVQAIRGCRGVTNQTHWALDIAPRWDTPWARSSYAPENLSVLRRIALDLLQHDTSIRADTRSKRLRAGWDDGHMLRLLAGAPSS